MRDPRVHLDRLIDAGLGLNNISKRTGITVKNLQGIRRGERFGELNGARILVISHGPVRGYPEFGAILPSPWVLRGNWIKGHDGIQRYSEATS